MKPTITVVRAVGAEFIRRIINPIAIGGALLIIVFLMLVGWLTTFNAWWWVVEAVLILITVIFIALLVAIYLALRFVGPTQSAAQKRAVSDFVDKLQRVAEHLQTPQFVVAYRVVRDTLRPRQDGFIENVSRDSKQLGPDFKALIRLFS